MSLLALFAIPELLGLLFMAALITADTWIGGRSWKP